MLRLSSWGMYLPATSLHRIIDALGIASITAYAGMAALSYFQTPALWSPAFSPHATAFFTQLYGEENLAAIRTFFGGPLAVIIFRWVPIFIASAAAVVLIALLSHNRSGRDDAVAQQILRWSLAFAVVCFFAYPVFTQDFWLSVVWGDMIASGVNPYYQKFTPEMLSTLPLDHFPMTMSYGPLWALISGGIMELSGGSIALAAFVFKAILLAAWCGSLLLVDQIMREFRPGSRTLALVIAGWVPLGVTETVAEGHNDVFLILPALLWVYLLLQKRLSAPIALVASMLCKYTTAPLFLVDLVHSLRSERITLSAYAARIALPALIGFAVLAVFYRSFSFFDGIRLVGSWHFMQPADAFAALSSVFGDWIAPFGEIMTAVFPVIAAYQCWVYWNRPDTEHLLRAVLAIMCAVTFAAVSHIWPWYLVWTLPLAALVPGWWLSRFILGLALLAPLTAAVWWVPEAENYKNIAAFLMYCAALLWAYTTSRKDADGPVASTGTVQPVDFAQAKERAALRAGAQRLEGDYQPEWKAAAGDN